MGQHPLPGGSSSRPTRHGANLSSNRPMVGYSMSGSASTCSGRWPTLASSPTTENTSTAALETSTAGARLRIAASAATGVIDRRLIQRSLETRREFVAARYRSGELGVAIYHGDLIMGVDD